MSADEVLVVEIGHASTEVVAIGPDSAPTPIYVPGLGGGVSGPVRFRHVQDAPQTVWTVPHGKGRAPIAWVLRDTEGTECFGYTVQNLDNDTARVSMEDPTAGSISMIF